MKVGLRIDVDTWRGTRDGVPCLLEILAKHGIQATFFFSVGPDNMGRHLWRLMRPAFLWKMFRSRALSLYGWDILLAGTAWPGRLIGQQLGSCMRETDAEGHEVGLHAWDHYSWQEKSDCWPLSTLTTQLQQGVETLSQILGRAVTCSAVPGWRADQRVIEAKQPFQFTYNSDCRGDRPFQPRLTDGSVGTLQLPVSLPTFDEIIGRIVTLDHYNEFILKEMQSQPEYAVYTLHAEVEGIMMAQLFDQLLVSAKARGLQFCPLGELRPMAGARVPVGTVVRGPCQGREGWVGCQQLEQVLAG
jgi:undecaprenyl phosphate-alpha-L-ara4FN deformylase